MKRLKEDWLYFEPDDLFNVYVSSYDENISLDFRKDDAGILIDFNGEFARDLHERLGRAIERLDSK